MVLGPPLPSPEEVARVPSSERVCRAACLGFALWTVCCHLVVAAGGGLWGLLVLFGVLGAAAAFAWPRWLDRHPEDRSESSPGVREQPPAGSAVPSWIRPAVLVVGPLLLFLAHRWGGTEGLWWALTALLGLGAWIEVLRRPAVVPVPYRSLWAETGLWALAAASVLVALFAHRPDRDDSFYVNVAVWAAETPGVALLSRDTLLGVEGLPIHLPVYRLHSYELANGALAFLTGLEPIAGFHWISAAVGAFLVPLCLASLCRLLTPTRWLWTAGATLFLLVAIGEIHRWYGNFGLVRIWQGKSIFLSAFLPLVWAYGMRFALRPSWPRWTLLAAAQIASVGFTSTALWLAPAAAWVGLATVLRPVPQDLRRFLWGASASAYVLAAGLLVRGGVKQGLESRFTTLSPDLVGEALGRVLGDGRLWMLGIAALGLAWACCPAHGLARRFAVVAPLAGLLVVLDPWLAEWMSKNVVGKGFWRAAWLLPLPLLIVLLSSLPLSFASFAGRYRRVRVASWVAVVGCVAIIGLWMPRYSGLSERNRVELRRPSLKVPAVHYSWAEEINRAAGPGAVVVAPRKVSALIPTFPDHAYPLWVRRGYVSHHRARLGEEDFLLRKRLTWLVEGEESPEGGEDTVLPATPAELLRQGLERFGIAAVCLRSRAASSAEMRLALEEEGFDRSREDNLYELWVRPAG